MVHHFIYPSFGVRNPVPTPWSTVRLRFDRLVLAVINTSDECLCYRAQNAPPLEATIGMNQNTVVRVNKVWQKPMLFVPFRGSAFPSEGGWTTPALEREHWIGRARITRPRARTLELLLLAGLGSLFFFFFLKLWLRRLQCTRVRSLMGSWRISVGDKKGYLAIKNRIHQRKATKKIPAADPCLLLANIRHDPMKGYFSLCARPLSKQGDFWCIRRPIIRVFTVD